MFPTIAFSASFTSDITFKAITGNTQGIAFKIIPPRKAKKIASKKLNPCVLLTSMKETRSILLSI